jgi:predicted RNA-binding Zn ribbon-like protein
MALLATQSTAGVLTQMVVTPTTFVFIGERLWLDFVNTDDLRRGVRVDVLRDFDALIQWLCSAGVLDGERATGIGRRAEQATGRCRRLRWSMLAVCARRSGRSPSAAPSRKKRAPTHSRRSTACWAGARALVASEPGDDGSFKHSFVPVGDAFAGLMIPVVESAAEALVGAELLRVRRCADGRCPRVFFDSTRNGRRRWCDMATCGNRAKAARFRARERDVTPAPSSELADSAHQPEARSA